VVGLAIGGDGFGLKPCYKSHGVLSDSIGREPIIYFLVYDVSLGHLVGRFADTMVWRRIGRFLQGAGAIAGGPSCFRR